MAVSLLSRNFKLLRIHKQFTQLRTGYVVLLPELDPEHSDKNPLFKNGLPNVENLTGDKCLSALGRNLLDLEETVRDVEGKIIQNDKVDLFEAVVNPLEEKNVQFESSWGLVKALYLTKSSIITPECYLSIHDRARKARSHKFNSRYIYKMFKDCDVSKLTEEEHRLVQKYVTEGKLNGLGLGGRQKEVYLETVNALSREKDLFRRRIMTSTKKFRHTIYELDAVIDFPEDVVRDMAQNENDWKKGPWAVTLNPAIANDFLSYCPKRDLRWNLWMARRQVASSFGGQPAELNNSQSLEKIRSLRRDLSSLLGYESFAHMSLETKMAGSLENVKKTLDLFHDKFHPQQLKEIADLQDFASSKGFKGTLELWDIPYWSRLHRKEKLGWDDVKIQEFFPLEKVLSGLMTAAERVFGLQFVASEMPDRTWHPDIRLFNIIDKSSHRPLAALYVDPYSRENKLNAGAQAIGIKPVARALGPSPPVAALIFNFKPPVKSRPTLLNFDSVEIVAKKFGVALQQLLCSVTYSDVSGLSNIEWDAVEVVNNFMSLWLNDPDVLRDISGHYKTGEPLNVTNFDQVRKHMAGFHICQELYLCNLDLELHTTKEFWIPVVKKTWPQYIPFRYDANDAHPCSFATSLTEMSAAYYSKLWAQMLAADAYETYASQENKAVVGSRFRDTFLGFGGACHPGEVFRRFQGRDPTPEAFIDRYSS